MFCFVQESVLISFALFCFKQHRKLVSCSTFYVCLHATQLHLCKTSKILFSLYLSDIVVQLTLTPTHTEILLGLGLATRVNIFD